IGGLLYAVVALEGVHAVLLQLCLRKKAATLFDDEGKRYKYVEEKSNKLLMDVGFSAMIELTSLVLLEVADRPAVEDIKGAQHGITIRNEIMHALAKKGQYQIRKRNNNDITKAYSAVMKMYDRLVTLVPKYSVPQSDGGVADNSLST